MALRFAARRAAKTGGGVEVLAIVEPQDFVQWGGVQAAIEEEQRLRIEGDRRRRRSARSWRRPGSSPRSSSGRAIRSRRSATISATREDIAALVLGAAPAGKPGPLVAHFTGNDAGKLPCPVMIIPGSLERRAAGTAELDSTRAESRQA